MVAAQAREAQRQQHRIEQLERRLDQRENTITDLADLAAAQRRRITLYEAVILGLLTKP